MNLLTAEKLTKSYTDKVLFQDADFSINEGDKIGVIGINGTGKTTLLRMVAGIEGTDGGTISKGNHVQIRYLSQSPVFEPDINVLQAVLKDNVNKLNEWSVESEARSILNKLGILDHEELVDHLSGGQRKRVALAHVLLAPAEILILDEPTNHLDHSMAEWLEEYLRNLNGALLMVTHDRYFLDRVSNRIIEIDNGNIYNYPGNYSEYIRLKEARTDMELASNRKRKTILKTELEWLARGARARSTKQKAHIARVMDLKEQKGPKEEQFVEMSSVASRLGKKTVEVVDIGKSYGDKKLILGYSYIFLKGDRVGIIGPNGCGKSTLLKIINGVIEPDAGYVEKGQTVKIGYFSQENEYMDQSLKVIDYIKEVGEYIQTKDGNITASMMLERFLFEGALQWTTISRLSGGEKRRLYLLRILMSAPNVLILDEPTNDLDIQTLTILEDYLDSFEGIVVTVSHDRYFLDRIVQRIFAFEGAGKVTQYEGGFSDYLLVSQKNELEDDNVSKNAVAKTPQTKKQIRVKKLKFTFQEQKEYETIDDDIASCEEKIAQLEREIEESSSNYTRLNELMDEKAAVETLLDEKMERWVYLNDLAEQIEQERSDN